MHYENRRRLKKLLLARVKNSFVIPKEPNVNWSIDFVTDKMECRRKFRVLNIIEGAYKGTVDATEATEGLNLTDYFP